MVVANKVPRKKTTKKSAPEDVQIMKAKKKPAKSTAEAPSKQKKTSSKSKTKLNTKEVPRKNYVTPPIESDSEEIQQSKLKKKVAKKNYVLAPPVESDDEFIEKQIVSKKKAAEKKSLSKPIKEKKVLKTKRVKKTIAIKSFEKSEDKEEEIDEETVELAKKYNVNLESLKKAIQGVIKFRENNPKIQNELFGEQFTLSLRINSITVPKTHNHIVRIPLKHSRFNQDSEICMIVSELKGVPNKDYDKHILHYEELLQKAGVNNIKKIMTFHEFRTEYETFEMKQRLVELYDMFLADGKICGKVVQKMGNIFYKKKKVATAINIVPNKVKNLVDSALSKTPLYLHGNGDTFTIDFGHSEMPVEHLVANIVSVLKGLDERFPGGMDNMRNISVSAFRAMSIPIYTSLKNKNDVKLPESISAKTEDKEEVTA